MVRPPTTTCTEEDRLVENGRLTSNLLPLGESGPSLLTMPPPAGPFKGLCPMSLDQSFWSDFWTLRTTYAARRLLGCLAARRYRSPPQRRPSSYFPPVSPGQSVVSPPSSGKLKAANAGGGVAIDGRSEHPLKTSGGSHIATKRIGTALL